ncbi:hypothetical protein [Allochromatium tepidum]|uniref:Uncharacterized protein n=1 Tax=Allochromatium tepidum TaxID=553982 RepID=A0ABM7QNX9_9GAMM|nr:hypothetical protein [Allochromatium tepidum]BCU07399.1 hypothetical protein Atep_20760 [Allochromatium tepidum]
MIEIIPPITDIETIAEGHGIQELNRLRQRYGPGNWKKKKGVALVRTDVDLPAPAEIHWYEAHGIGKVKLKVKRWL